MIVKDRLFGKTAEPQIKRIEYAGLPLPDWEVPCVNGKECTRGVYREKTSAPPSLLTTCLLRTQIIAISTILVTNLSCSTSQYIGRKLVQQKYR
jgi:hypothetical protein